MMRSALRIGGLVLALTALPHLAHAVPVTVNFDDLTEGVLTDIPGLTFTNAFVLTSGAVGGSLNEFDFPPRSGDNVVFDDGAPISISFTSLVYNLSGYFWYSVGLTMTAFDAAGGVLDDVTSALTSRLGSDPAGAAGPELLALTSSAGISSILISGDPFGGSFTLDDLTYDTDPTSGGPPPTQSVPEPATLALVLLGGLGLAGVRRRTPNTAPKSKH